MTTPDFESNKVCTNLISSVLLAGRALPACRSISSRLARINIYRTVIGSGRLGMEANGFPVLAFWLRMTSSSGTRSPSPATSVCPPVPRGSIAAFAMPAAGAKLSIPMLNLGGDGLELKQADGSVLFDHDADGIRTCTGWLSANDGIFVRNGNGTIDSGRERARRQHSSFRVPFRGDHWKFEKRKFC